MKNIWNVFSYEFRTTLLRPSFLIMLFLLPLLGSGIFMVLSNPEMEKIQEFFGNLLVPDDELTVDGFVDHSGIITNLPQAYEDWLIPYETEKDALKALEADQISGYYVIAEDYLESGSVEYTRKEFNPFKSFDQSDFFEGLITLNLIGGNENEASLLNYPAHFDVRQISSTSLENGESAVIEEEVTEADSATAYLVPYLIVFMFYIVLLGSSTLMLNSVSTEKTNRVIEILMTTIRPSEMMIGKLAALGLIGLIQTTIWSGTGMFILSLSGKTGILGQSVSISLPLNMVFWMLFYFILGYTLYASLMAGIGALTSSSKEASQVTMLVIAPLILPMMLINIIAMEPNSGFTTVLSLIPLTTPVVMPARLAITSVPFWQILVSVVSLVGTVALIVSSISRLFHAQNLLGGDTINIKQFVMALIGKSIHV